MNLPVEPDDTLAPPSQDFSVGLEEKISLVGRVLSGDGKVSSSFCNMTYYVFLVLRQFGNRLHLKKPYFK